MNKPLHIILRRQSLFCKLFLLIFLFTTLVTPTNIVVANTDIYNHWAEKSITRWQDCGIVAGYPDGSFRPNAYITKAEFITILNHIYGFYDATADNYADVHSNDWFYDQTAIAKNSAYMAWYSEENLKPNEKITRQEVCATIVSILDLKASDSFDHLNQFKDTKNIAQWAKPYLDASVSSGYISGYPDKTLRPTGFITRAEVLTILDKSTGHFIYQSGTYGADEGTEVYEGNLTINTAGVSLKNILVKGSLILAAGIGQGNVALSNITVEGKTVINGGGEHSITFTDSHLGELLVYKQDGRIRVVSANSSVGKTILMSNTILSSSDNSNFGAIQIIGQAKTITLDGNYDEITVETPTQVRLTDSSEIANFEITSGASNSTVIAGAQSKIGKITFNGNADVYGEGTINNAIINVNGVTIEQPVDNQIVSSNVIDNTSTTPSTPSNSLSNDDSSDNSSDDDSSKDTTAPSGYQITVNKDFINRIDEKTLSFYFSQAEIGTTYAYTLSSSSGGVVLSGKGSISNANQQVATIDLSPLLDGTITLTARLTDAAGNAGKTVSKQIIKDTVAPVGHSLHTDSITVYSTSSASISFTLIDAEVNTTCFYSISSNQGGTAITGNTTVLNSTQQFSNIDISTLPDGILTLSVILVDSVSNSSLPVTDTVKKDVNLPNGYSISIDQSQINAGSPSTIDFTFHNAEIGSQFEYKLSSSNGTKAIIGSGTILDNHQQILGIDTSTLPDGVLTLSATLTDSAGNTGARVSDQIIKDLVAPKGYSLSPDSIKINTTSGTSISFIINDAEIGTTCHYTISSDGGGTAVTNSSSITSADQQISNIDVSALPDGQLTLSLMLKDTVLNSGVAVTGTVLKDTTAPSSYNVTLDQDHMNASNQNALSFTLSGAEIGSQFEYTLTSDGGAGSISDTGTIASVDQQINSIDTSALPDGTLTLSLKLLDIYGNVGSILTKTVLKDTEAPTGYGASIDNATINTANKTNFTFTLSGAEIGTTCYYTISSDGGGTDVTDSSTITSAEQQISNIDVSALPDGQLTLSLMLKDTVLNSGTAVTSTVLKDTTAPSGYDVSLDQSHINASNQDALSFTLNGAEIGSHFEYTLTSDGGAGSVTDTGTISSADQQINSIDTTALPDGTLTLSIILIDTASNLGIAHTDTITKDTTAPSSYNVTLDQSHINASNQEALSFTLSDAEIGSQFEYTLTSDGGAGSVTDTGTISSADQQITSIDTTALPDGTLTLSLKLSDIYGNIGNDVTATISKDTIAPVGYTASIDNATINTANKTNFTFTLNGAEIGTTCYYTISSDGGGTDVADSSTITSADQQFSNIDVSTLPDGQLTLSLMLKDTVLNSGTAVTSTVLKDTTAPSGYSATLDQSHINASNQDALSFTLSGAEIGSHFEYTFTSDGGAGSVTDTGTITSADQQINSIDTSALPDGTLTLSLKLSDVYGNMGSNVTATISKDTIAPIGYTASIDNAIINTANKTNFIFTLSGAEIGTTCYYTISSDGGGTDVTDSSTITSADQQISNIDVSTLTDGTLILSILLTDTVLNSGTAVTSTVLKDTTAPSGYDVSLDQSHINASNQDALSFTLSGAEIGSHFEYTLTSDGGAGSVTDTGTISSADQQINSIDTTALPDGTLTLSIILIDTASNLGIAHTDTITKDTIAPSSYNVTFDQSHINASNQNALSFTLSSAEIGSQFEYTLTSDGGAGSVTDTGTITSADQQITSIDTSALPDGTLTLSLKLLDIYGNMGNDVTATISKDTIAPVGYTASIDNATINTANKINFTFTLSGAEIGTTCYYTISSDGGGTDITGNLAITSADQQISNIDVSTLPDGQLTLSLMLKDTVLNSGIAVTSTVLKDTTAPSGYGATLDQSHINASNQDALSFTLSGAEIGSQFEYTLTSDGGAGSVTDTGTITSADHQITSIDTSALPDGTLTLSLKLSDVYGNMGSNVTATISKDTIAPIGYTASIDNAIINTANKTNFIFTLSGSEIGTTCYYTISSDGGGTDVTASSTITSADQQISNIDVSTLADGTLTLSIILTDTVLNSGTAVTSTVLKDTTAPNGYSATLDQSHINASNQDALSFTLSGAEIGSQFEYTLTSDGGAGSVTDTGTISSVDQQINSIDTTALPDGTLTLSIILIDTASNLGIARTDTIIKDTTAPSGYSAILDQGHMNASNQDTLSFTLSGAEIGSQFEYTLTSDGGAGSVTDTGTIVSADQQITSIDTSALPDGTLTLSLKLSDIYGNIGNDFTATISKDIIAPVGYTVSIDMVNVDNTNNNNFAFTLTGAEIGTICHYTISSDGGGTAVTDNTTITNVNQQISGIDVSTLSDGILTLSIILTDTALNSGLESTDTVTKDADPPTGYSILFDQSLINNANQTTVSFSFANAEVNSTYEYTLISSGGMDTLTGSGSITTDSQQISGIDVTSLNDGTLTLKAKLTDSVGHVGVDVTDTVLKDTIPPTGYGVNIDAESVNKTNYTAFSFTLSDAEIGATCAYTISSNNGGSPISGSTVISDVDQQISAIAVSTLPDGNLTLSVVLSDTALNSGVASTDSVIKDTTPPSGYSVSFYQSNIHPQNQTSIDFIFASAEVNASYEYTISSENGGTPVTGSGTISTSTDQINGIDLSGLADGTLTLTCTLTDTDGNVSTPITTNVRKSPYADLRVSGYEVYYNNGTPVNVAGNGTYIYYQMENGKPSYILELGDETFIIHWYDSYSGEEWSITNYGTNSERTFYFSEATGPLPPESGWRYTSEINVILDTFKVEVVTP